LGAALLAGCGTAPPPDAIHGPEQPVADPSDREGALRAFEAQWRERAQAAERQARLADALLAWEVLALLRPGRYDGELAVTRGRIASVYADRLQRGEQEFKRGNLEKAEQLYLSAQALQPQQQEAANALRALERSRNKRDFLGQASRLTAGKANAAGQLDAALEREQVASLARQGELDGAIELLETRLAANPSDGALRALAADVYVKKAESLLPHDGRAAKAWLDKALRWQPDQPRALALQKSLAPAAARVPAN
jgi:hypothetical protein